MIATEGHVLAGGTNCFASITDRRKIEGDNIFDSRAATPEDGACTVCGTDVRVLEPLGSEVVSINLAEVCAGFDGSDEKQQIREDEED